ncbi:hypothetical protein M9Y10_003404 [Tritrichomonas musculus]|uniref:ribonuclease Z n=1 Tax=Tritrichomonas musculus TaxID=1915356 RepID=A0ABR2JPB8_9EUKA
MKKIIENVHIETISGRTLDTSPSFILNIQNNKYAFNIPEMFQRSILATHTKIKNFQSVFITSLYPDSVGGLSCFILQSYFQKKELFQIIGPKEIPEVILFDCNYVGEQITGKYQIEVNNNFSNADIDVNMITLSRSVCYDVLLKRQNQHILIVDCRSIEDLAQLPDLNLFTLIFHLTIPEILIQKDYITFFTSNVNTTKEKNFCFMPSGIISNVFSNKFYTQKLNGLLQPLAHGNTLKPPKGFINLTSEKSVYDIIEQKLEITNQGELIEIDYDVLKNLNGLQILFQLIQFEPQLPTFEKYAITFLGSTTKFVSVLRNNSGYLIHTKNGFIILDPSEGFLGQIKRKYGPKLTEYILKNIECIWISHYHHDHCFGACSLLYERSKLTEKEIFFLAPQKLIDDIQIVSHHYGDFHVIYHNREGQTDEKSEVATIQIDDHLCIQSVDVFHDVPFAKGCMFVIDDSIKIAFSGDRAYKQDQFADVFKNVDALIHEGTFPDRLKGKTDKFIKKHSFLGEAIETSIEMKSKFTMITHLSQRYTDEELEKKISDNIMFVFDFLEFTEENAKNIFDNIA